MRHEVYEGRPEAGSEIPIHERRIAQLRPFVIPGQKKYYFTSHEFPPDKIYHPHTDVVAALLRRGASADEIDRVFTPDSRIIPASYIDFDINADEDGKPRDVGDVLSYLRGSLEDHLRLVDPSLKDEDLQWKNNHGPNHARRTARIEDMILSQTGLSPTSDVRRAAAVAGYTHDIGAVFGYIPHPYFSAMTWEEFLPHLQMTEKQRKDITSAVMFHDTETISEVFEEAHTQSLSDLISIRRRHGEIASALTMADKFDFGPWRLPEGSPSDDINNPHRIVNLYGQTPQQDGFVFSESLDRFVWKIEFGKNLSEDALERFPQFTIRNRDGKVVPRQSNLLQGNDFDQWESLYWTLYYPRTMMVVIDAFALNPLLEEVVIVMTNESNPNSQGLKLHNFRRGSIDETMRELFQKRVPDAKKEKLEYRIFADLKDDLPPLAA